MATIRKNLVAHYSKYLMQGNNYKQNEVISALNMKLQIENIVIKRDWYDPFVLQLNFICLLGSSGCQRGILLRVHPSILRTEWINWKIQWNKANRFGKILFSQTKGQIISKCLFGVFNFYQKTNENTSHTSKNEFRSFFGRILGLTICFRN